MSEPSFPRWFWPALLALHVVPPLLVFTDLTSNPFYTQIALLHAGVFAVLIAVGVRALRKGSWSVRGSSLFIPLAAWGGTAALSLAVNAVAAVPPLRPGLVAAGEKGMLFYGATVLFPFVMAAQDSSRAWGNVFRRGVVGVGLAAGIYGIFQYFGVEWFWPSHINPYNGRPVSTFGNPTFLSSYLVLVVPTVMVEFGTARGGATWGWGGTILIMAGALLCTLTRSSWVGVAAGVGFLLWITRRTWRGDTVLCRRWALMGALAAALVFLWPVSPVPSANASPRGRVMELVRGVRSTTPYAPWHQRILIARCARDMIRDHPLLGKGPGCFELFYPFYQGRYLGDTLFRSLRTHANNAHNILLEIWSTTGWIGAMVFGWGVALFLAFGLKPPSSDPAGLFPAALFAGLAGFLVDNMMGNVSAFFTAPAFLAAWMAGCLAGHPSLVSPHIIRGGKKAAITAGAVWVMVGSAGMFFTVRAWWGEVIHWRGSKALLAGRLREAEVPLEQAHRLNPGDVHGAYDLANLYAQLAERARAEGLTLETDRRSQEALKAYGSALKANPGYDEIYHNRGVLLEKMGRGEEARSDAGMAAWINPPKTAEEGSLRSP
jgi:O-antigen ligase